MPVTINDFEMVTEPPRAAAPSPAPPVPPAPAGLTPADIERLMRRLAERRARVAAD